jgi:pilus assembly protein CpaB
VKQTVNSRQRRGVLLLVLSAIAAIAAFAGVLAVVRDVKSKVGPEVTAYRLKADVAPYQELSPQQFEKISMPRRWLSGTAVTDLSEIRGKIAVTTLREGSLLQSDMVVDRPELRSGEQEIAIMIDASTGVAGKITAGARVNIFATFEGEDRGRDQSRLIVQNARVIDVGKLTALQPDGSGPNRRTATEAVPITFALSTADAQRVAYAESFAEHVRLALVAGGDDTSVPPADRTYTLEQDKQ